MSSEITSQQPTTNQNVATDEASIYQGGGLVGITIDDLLHNKTALQMLLNDLNISRRDFVTLAREAQELRLEQARSNSDPIILGMVALMNVVSVVMVGVGVNYMTSESPPRAAEVVLLSGATLALACAVTPVIISALAKRRRKEGGNAN
jgi:hypothetical protein